MEPVKRMVACSTWNHLPEEVVSLITIKVAETLEAPLEDLRSLQLCNKVTKRVSWSQATVNRFNLGYHY
jgi:hypothetical protein